MTRWTLLAVICAALALGACNDSEDPVGPSADAADAGGDAGDGSAGDTAAETGADPEVCNDGADNDGDGDADCEDSDCAAEPACAPPTERCDDGTDNDGDGAIDCDDDDCADDPLCAPPAEICTDGEDNDGDESVDCADDDCADDPACAVDPCADIDCADLDGPCLVGVCDPATGECVAEPSEDGTVCDDGDLCTTGDVCTAGECAGGELDCSDQSDACNAGACDPEDGTCGPVPLDDGTICEDGDPCTTDDACSSGVCGGVAVDCSDYDFRCVVGVCDTDSGECTTAPAEDGISCTDADPCSVDEVCVEGECAGVAMDCSELDGACAVGACADETGTCETIAIGDFEACDDTDPCTEDDACFDGICEGFPADCSDFDGPCALGVCNSDTGECASEHEDDGIECDAENDCLTSTVCEAGECVGTEVEDGSECFVGSVCIVDTACEAGECVGFDHDCSDFDDQCNVGVCVGGFIGPDCGLDPVADSTPCDDGDGDTGGDLCLNGECAGCAADDAEDDDVVEDATDIELGAAITERSACAADADWYTFSAPDTSIVVASVLGDGYPCSGLLAATLFDAEGAELAADIESGPTRCPFVSATGAASLRIAAVPEAVFPGYGLRVSAYGSAESEDNGEADTADDLEAGGAVLADLESDDEDWFVFTIEEGQRVTVFTSGVAGPGTCDTDTVLTLRDGEDMSVLAENDDTDGLCSEIVATLEAGTYFATVRGWRSFTVGPYAIHLRTETPLGVLAEAESNDACEDANGPITGPTSYVGAIDPGGDVDLLEIEIAADGTDFMAATSDGAGGCAMNTVIRLYDSTCLTELVSDDDGGVTPCSRLEETLDAGTYVIGVEAFGIGTGDYVLDVIF